MTESVKPAVLLDNDGMKKHPKAMYRERIPIHNNIVCADLQGGCSAPSDGVVQLALVNDALGLVLGTGIQTAVRMHDDTRRLDADPRLERCGDLCRDGLVVLRVIGVLLDLDRVLVREILLEDADEVFAGDAVLLADDRFNIAREHIDGGDDEHVVLTPEDVDPAVRSAALARRLVDAADVAGAEADQRSCVLAERREDQLAGLAGRQDLAGVEIDRLHEDVVLRDVQAVVIFALCRARAENVGQSVEVVDPERCAYWAFCSASLGIPKPFS